MGITGTNLRWADVARIHRVPGGVYMSGGRIVSLLVSDTAYYRDIVGANEIQYSMSPGTSKHFLKAFESAINERHGFRVFRKKSETRTWMDLGFFKAISGEKTIKRGVETILYTLVKVEGSKPGT